MDLTQLKEDVKAKIKEIQAGKATQQKLNDMGIMPGREIVKINSQFFKGPVIVKAGRCQLALGFGLAKKIKVEVIK